MDSVGPSPKRPKRNDYCQPEENSQRQEEAVLTRLYRDFQNNPADDSSLFKYRLYCQLLETAAYPTKTEADQLARLAISESQRAQENRRYDQAKEHAFQACLYSPNDKKIRAHWIILNSIFGGNGKTAPVSQFYDVIPHELIFNIACFLDRRSMKNFLFTCRHLYKSLFENTLTHLLNRAAPIPRSFADNYPRSSCIYQKAPLMKVTYLDLSKLDFDLAQKAFWAIPNARCIKLFETISDDQMEAIVPHLKDCDTLYMEKMLAITNISSMIVKYPNNLRNLHLKLSSVFNGFDAVGNHCSTLQSLSIKSCGVIRYESIEKIIKNNPDLRSLTLEFPENDFQRRNLTDPQICSIFQNCKNITHLDLSHVSNKVLTEIAKVYNENLKTLVISLIPLSVNSGFQKIAEHCTNLQHLDITGGRDETGRILDKLVQITRKCKLLAVLKIEVSPSFSDAGFRKIFTNCTGLQHLDSFKNICSDITIREIIKKSDRWKTLDFQESPISDETLEEISKRSNYLETLNLDECSQFTANGLMKLIENSPRLQDLYLGQIYESNLAINDEHLISIATRCEYLAKINLSFHGSEHLFTLAGIKRLIDLCGNLEWIGLGGTYFDKAPDDILHEILKSGSLEIDLSI